VAEGDVIVARDVARVATRARTAMGDGGPVAIDHADLAVLEVAVVLQQLVEHRRCRKALAQQPQRELVVALLGEGLADRDTGHRLHAAGVAADRDRERRDADPHAPCALAATKNGVGHAVLPSLLMYLREWHKTVIPSAARDPSAAERSLDLRPRDDK